MDSTNQQLPPNVQPQVPDFDNRRVIRNNYKRQPKPPYPYLGMIAMAIELSEHKMLTLGGVHDQLKEMFSFFSGEYKGWKDSVRHNLSFNACFVKADFGGDNSRTKMNFWTVDLALVPPHAFKRQETKVSRSGDWALNLHEELGVPPLVADDGTVLESSRRQPVMMSSSAPYPFKHCSFSPFAGISSTTNYKRGSSFLSDASPCVNSAEKPKSSKRKRVSSNSVPVESDSIMKLLNSSVYDPKSIHNQDVAANNLRLLSQHFDFAQSQQSGYYRVQNPMDTLQGHPYNQVPSYYGFQPVPYYYTPPSSMWYPHLPSYVQQPYYYPMPNHVMYPFSPLIPHGNVLHTAQETTSEKLYRDSTSTPMSDIPSSPSNQDHCVPASSGDVICNRLPVCSPISSPISVCGTNDSVNSECALASCSSPHNSSSDHSNILQPVLPATQSNLSLASDHAPSPFPLEQGSSFCASNCLPMDVFEALDAIVSPEQTTY